MPQLNWRKLEIEMSTLADNETNRPTKIIIGKFLCNNNWM